MDHPRTRALVEAAIAAARAEEPSDFGDEGTVPAAVYTDPARLEAELRALFSALPIPLALSSELGKSKAIVRDLAGVSLVLARGDDGVARAFRNACRHRGTRLLREDGAHKCFVCPYHGWTYGLEGRLRHVPRAESFPSLDMERHGLTRVNVEERHGLVWVSLSPTSPSVQDHLGAIDDEIAALGFASHVVARRVLKRQRGNWKLLMEAFLEGYHVKILHKATVAPFFLDACGIAERQGPHVRHATARRAAAEASLDSLPLRELATVGYVVFPCSVFIAHPDWTSHVVVQPVGPNEMLWYHAQLLAAPPESEEAERHFARSFELIEDKVFQSEDLFAIAEIQAGLATGANEELTFGKLEHAALWFHEAIADALSARCPR